jgi:hypothetical protein
MTLDFHFSPPNTEINTKKKSKLSIRLNNGRDQNIDVRLKTKFKQLGGGWVIPSKSFCHPTSIMYVNYYCNGRKTRGPWATSLT